eukprot:TRINITY_DN6445_c0_g3_i1.p1 TRINITY_DN6445_c0_g3~~TRINITY_DN6445_c0_g3_i1.p1  ORF type:complete len:141 (-),score=12.88 TRINITY_DN6445_c0_g3_i1:511-933(-)
MAANSLSYLIVGCVDFVSRLVNVGRPYDNILPNFLWLGNIVAASDHNFLHQNSITHVLSLSQWKVQFHDPKHFKYKIFAVDDVPQADLTPHFEEACDFISSCKKDGGRILVHCNFGMSRSVSVLTAYLMKSQVSFLSSHT